MTCGSMQHRRLYPHSRAYTTGLVVSVLHLRSTMRRAASKLATAFRRKTVDLTTMRGRWRVELLVVGPPPAVDDKELR